MVLEYVNGGELFDKIVSKIFSLLIYYLYKILDLILYDDNELSICVISTNT